MNSTERRISVLLSVQRALLGEVGSQLRGVRVSYGEANIRIEAYFDGSITEDDRESMSCVETEVIADFPDSVDVRCEVVRLDAPARLPQVESWVYHRKESVPPSDEPEDDSFLATLQDLVELQNKVRFLARHREGRAILTSLEGAVTRLMAARDDHEDLMGALDPSGDMYRQDKALGHFFVDAVTSIECFAVACHHLAAVIRPEAFDTSTANLVRVHLEPVARAYTQAFPESTLAAALNSIASSDVFKDIKAYRNTLTHRQVLARALPLPTSSYGSDLVPSNPAAHPSEWNLTVPFGALTLDRLAFLEKWFASTTPAFAEFVQANVAPKTAS
jgi:hypothetical protein